MRFCGHLNVEVRFQSLNPVPSLSPFTTISLGRPEGIDPMLELDLTFPFRIRIGHGENIPLPLRRPPRHSSASGTSAQPTGHGGASKRCERSGGNRLESERVENLARARDVLPFSEQLNRCGTGRTNRSREGGDVVGGNRQ